MAYFQAIIHHFTVSFEKTPIFRPEKPFWDIIFYQLCFKIIVMSYLPSIIGGTITQSMLRTFRSDKRTLEQEKLEMRKARKQRDIDKILQTREENEVGKPTGDLEN